jgi:parvulin-like peptidyl-prolyl isomerase
LSIGKRVVTVADIDARIKSMTPEMRALYATPEARQKYLEQTIDQEIFAKVAEDRGYASDPAVLEATRRAMVLKLLRERIGPGPGPADVNEVDLRKYYDEHPDEFGAPAVSRVQAVLFKDQAAAESFRSDIGHEQAEQAGPARLASFTALAQQRPNAARVRDLDLLQRYEPAGASKEIYDATWGLAEVGDVSAVVPTNDGFYVLQLKERTHGAPRSFDEVRPRVIRAVSEQLKNSKMETLAAELAREQHAAIHRDNFDKVRFESGLPPGAHASRE